MTDSSGPVKGAQLSAQQIAAATLSCGFRDGKGYQGKGWTWSVAIVLAESGGNGNAVNHNSDGSEDHGYFQWNTVYHPEGVAVAGDIVAESKLALTVTNNGADWHQWSTFNNGQAAAQLTNAAAACQSVVNIVNKGHGFGAGFWDAVGGAINGATGGVAGDAVGAVNSAASAVGSAVSGTLSGIDGVAQALGGIGNAIGSAAKWVGDAHNWVRVLEVIGGLGMIAGGIALIKPQLAGAIAGPEGLAATEALGHEEKAAAEAA